MHQAILSTLMLTLLSFVAGCGGVSQRSEPSEIEGKVTITGNVSPGDLTITFQPQQNSLPGGAKLGRDGGFKVKLTPGKYAYFFDADANATVAAFKKLPAAYHKPTADRVVTVSEGYPIEVEVK